MDVAAGDAPEEDVDEAEEALVVVVVGRRPPLGGFRMVDGEVEGAPNAGLKVRGSIQLNLNRLLNRVFSITGCPTLLYIRTLLKSLLKSLLRFN